MQYDKIARSYKAQSVKTLVETRIDVVRWLLRFTALYDIRRGRIHEKE